VKIHQDDAGFGYRFIADKLPARGITKHGSVIGEPPRHRGHAGTRSTGSATSCAFGADHL